MKKSTIFFSFLVSFIFVIIPFPAGLSAFRPPLIILLILYLYFYIPSYVNLYSISMIGFLLDVLCITSLGEHVFAISLMLICAQTKALRFHLLSLEQQMGLLMLFLWVYEVSLGLMDAFLGLNPPIYQSCLSVFLAVLIWPFIKKYRNWEMTKYQSKG